MKLTKRNISELLTSSVRNDRGSSSVFLTIVLASMIIMTFAVVAAADRIAAAGYSDGVLNLAGRSVMSEFHVGLKDHYGLFAFPGSPGDIKNKLSYYAKHSLDENDNTPLEEIKVDVTDNVLGDAAVLYEEITGYVKYAMAEDLIEKLAEPESKGEGKAVVKFGDNMESAVIRNEDIINTLPSGEMEETSSLWVKVNSLSGSWKKLLKGTGENMLLNYYIFDKFKNAQDQSADLDTFFRCEAEYILKGKYDDEANYKAVRRDLLLLRNALNLVNIYTDPVRRAELSAVAAMIVTPPVSFAAEFVLAELWALAEAENDVRLLEHGEKVPMVKTRKNWALSAENVLVKEKSEYISMKNKTGLTYQGYLQLFMLVCDRGEKLTRMMDLIQINMKGNYNGDFLMAEMNRGFRFKAVVNGREFKYEERY